MTGFRVMVMHSLSDPTPEDKAESALPYTWPLLLGRAFLSEEDRPGERRWLSGAHRTNELCVWVLLLSLPAARLPGGLWN